MAIARDIYQVQGPPGSDGAAGAAGSDGVSSYTTTTAAFTVPASGSSVTIAVGSGLAFTVGQTVYIQNAGTYEVTAASATQMTVKNLGYTGNAAATASISSSRKVSPSGLQGPTGTSSLAYFHVNLGGTDQSGVVTATPTKVNFNTEVADSGSYFNTATYRLTPTVSGAYAFYAAVQVNSLSAAGNIVQVHLYKNGAVAATGKTVARSTENVQASVAAVLTANGTTDYFEVYVEQNSGANKTVEGDEEVTNWSGHWVG